MCEQAGLRLECIQFSAPLPGQTGDSVLKSPQKIPPPEAGNYQDYAVIARRSSVPLESHTRESHTLNSHTLNSHTAE